ncbi:MAG: divalent-cation tolerance protein CutA [Candidatus Jorgensenbacteria bacterium]|nr:divalent-cation tolerance protein CutA [Candidatus Jorgensenbacteria bacterium]
MVFIYTTCRDEEEGKKISELIVSRHLAACVDMWPIDSCYIWENALKCEKEYAVLVKTNETKVQDIEDLVSKNHSYSTPFIATVDVRRLNREYKEWMSQVVR